MELQGEDARRAYLFAGHAILTLEGREKRFTYKIKRKKTDPSVHFVSLLCGPDNELDYHFIGVVVAERYRHSLRSRVDPEAQGVKAFAWFTRHLGSPDVAVLHSGRCGRCGRTLTTPESIRTGLGPVCSGKE